MSLYQLKPVCDPTAGLWFNQRKDSYKEMAFLMSKIPKLILTKSWVRDHWVETAAGRY